MAVEAHATAKYIRTSAQKAGLVLDLIRGRDVNHALATLRFARKGVARDIEKVLRSAIANAQTKDGFGGDVDRLFVTAVLRQPGPVAEAHPPGPDGPRVPRREAHRAPDGARRRAAGEDRRSGPTAGEAPRPRRAGAKPKAQAGARSRPRRRDGAPSAAKAAGRERERRRNMGQKVHPHGFRLGFNKTWRSRWYADKDYAKLLHEDLKLRDTLKTRFAHAGVSKIEIERAANKLKIDIYTSRPGIIIGRKGTEVDKLKQEIQKKTSREVFINIQEIQKPELDAQLIGESVAMQLEKRVAFRRAMRKAVESALRFGARGIKVRVSGRLNGAEIARSEWYLHGQLPLQTLRADIDYGFAQAFTTYGASASRCGSTRASA